MVEAGELDGPGTEYFLRRSLDSVLNRPRLPQRILLGCTHYPLLLPALRRLVPPSVELLSQGEIVSSRLANWLERHPERETRLTRNGRCRFATTDDATWFSAYGQRLLGRSLTAERIRLSPLKR
jgi:glutamate racemase